MNRPDRPFDLIVRNTSEVLCVTGEATEPAEQALRPIRRGVVGVRGDRVAFVGEEDGVPEGAVTPETEIIDARGGFVGPGFVDCHTHLVFAGDRSSEFELRNQGATYLDIAKAGGGIMNTVKATRGASEDELIRHALPRLKTLLSSGVTCVEAKSGYGLNVVDELKMLKAIQRAGSRQSITVVPTLLCAHAIPEEHKADRARYVDICIQEIIPKVVEGKLARFCDVFAEEGAFTLEEARRILEAGKAGGLIPRVHAEQLTASGAARLAAEVGASSADHLEHLSPEDAQVLAKAGVVGVLLPTATLFVRARPFANARRLRDAGVTVALATNLNPGSAMSENVALTLGLACLENGLTAAEAYFAFTAGGAKALRLEGHGRIVVGGPADLVIFRCSSYRHLPYHLGINHAGKVIRGGKVEWKAESETLCG
jgi:imidazolonepropionase